MRKSTCTFRSGFTLVELLVVIAIIGLLIGLLLPAVLAAREAARRMSCQNNLKQLALASTIYHGTHDHFPPNQCGGEIGWGAESKSWSWLSRILPFIEQGSLFDEADIPRKTLKESGVMDRQIGAFLCPSDSYSNRGPRDDAGNLPGILVGQTNYQGVSGANWGADEDRNLDDIGTEWKNQGTNGSYDGLDRGDGILWRSNYGQKSISASQVFDGLSNTFLIGEALPERSRWCSWPDANNAHATCAIPPNDSFDDPHWWPNSLSFRSAHSGGLFFAHADGSVHFINDNIDLEVYRSMATRDGNEAVGDDGKLIGGRDRDEEASNVK